MGLSINISLSIQSQRDDYSITQTTDPSILEKFPVIYQQKSLTRYSLQAALKLRKRHFPKLLLRPSSPLPKL